MSDKIRLNRKQVTFITTWLEENNPELAAEKFMTLMIEERLDPKDICLVIDKIIQKLEKSGK